MKNYSIIKMKYRRGRGSGKGPPDDGAIGSGGVKGG
jgi:hypothetical protein